MPLDSFSYNSPLRAGASHHRADTWARITCSTGVTQTKWRTSSCTSSKRSRVFDPLADRLLVDIVDHCHHHHLAIVSRQAEGSSLSALSDFCSSLVITESRAVCRMCAEFGKARSCVCPILDRADCADAYQGAPRMQSMGSRALRHRLCRL